MFRGIAFLVSTAIGTSSWIRQLSAEGMTKQQIAEHLNTQGFTPCRSRSFTPQIIDKLKQCYGIVSNAMRARRGELTFAYTLAEMAHILKVERFWIYGRIAAGTIKIERDPRYHCYLFPKDRKTLEELKRLKSHKVDYVSIQNPCCNG